MVQQQETGLITTCPGPLVGYRLDILLWNILKNHAYNLQHRHWNNHLKINISNTEVLIWYLKPRVKFCEHNALHICFPLTDSIINLSFALYKTDLLGVWHLNYNCLSTILISGIPCYFKTNSIYSYSTGKLYCAEFGLVTVSSLQRVSCIRNISN